MRVGIDWRPASLARGGVGAYVRELVGAYADAFPGDRLALYAHGLRPALRARAVPPGAVRAATPLPSRVAEVLARFAVGADHLVGGCDVFHLTDYALLRPARAALVATVHDALFLELPGCYTPAMRRGLRRTTEALVARARRLVVPSLRTKTALVERLRAEPARVDVVPLAARAFPDTAPATLPRPYVLALGTLEPRKNHLRLLAAHREALARGLDLDLVVAGAPGWRCDDVLAALVRAPRVRFEASPDDARVAALLSGAAGLAYPSLGEGYGLPVVEALACGLPVLSSAAVPSAAAAGDAAILVDPYDVDALAEGLLRLAQEAGPMEQREARRGAVASLSWRATAQGTRRAYERACA